MTRMDTTSLETAKPARCSGKRLAALRVLASTMRWPMYSTVKERKRPAMTMADVTASYPRSPMHLLPNMREACV